MKYTRAILLFKLCLTQQVIIAAAAALSQPTSATSDITAQRMLAEDSKVFASVFYSNTPAVASYIDSKQDNFDGSAAAFTAATSSSDYTKAVAGKICLKELTRSPLIFPTPYVASQIFTTTFACCEQPDVAVAGCKFQTNSFTEAKLTGMKTQLDEQVGSFEAWCMFKHAGPCVPEHMLGRMFTTSSDSSKRYWLEVDATLQDFLPDSDKYAQSMSGSMAQDTQSTQSSQAPAPHDVADTLTELPRTTRATTTASHAGGVQGKVSQFSAILEGSPGLVKGGTLDYTAGFVDSLGNVVCPAGATSGLDTNSMSAQPRALQIHVKCGLLMVKIRYVDLDNYDKYDNDDNYDNYAHGYNEGKSAAGSEMQSTKDKKTLTLSDVSSHSTVEGHTASPRSNDLPAHGTKQQQVQSGNDKDAQVQDDTDDFWHPRSRKTSRPGRIARKERQPALQ